MAISGFTDGNTMVAGIVCDWFRRIYRHPVLDKYPFFATIVADVLFLRAQLLRYLHICSRPQVPTHLFD